MKLQLIGLVALAWGCLSTSLPAQEEQQFLELFGKDIEAASATAHKKDDSELAVRFLAAAKELKSDSKLRALLLRKTHEFGSKDASGYATAIAALDLFADDHPDREEVCTDAILVLHEKLYYAAKPSDRKTVAESLAQRLVLSSEQKLTVKKTADAIAALRKALGLAGIAASETGAELQERMRLLSDRLQKEKQANELYGRLFKNRQDQDAMGELVRLLLIELDWPADAVKLAPDVQDEALARVLAVVARPIDMWTVAEAETAALWFESQSSSATPAGKRQALARAVAATERQLAAFEGDEVARLKIKVRLEGLTMAIASLDSKSTAIRRPRVKYVSGLMARLYPRHRSQEDGNLYTGWVPPAELGEPVGRAQMIGSVTPLKYPPTNNVVARGFLKIDTPGEYAFNATAGHDRCALYVGGEIVCPFRDGEEKIVRVTLEKGMIPIQVVGMVVPDGQCSVRWQPPGATDLVPIPLGAMFYTAD